MERTHDENVQQKEDADCQAPVNPSILWPMMTDQRPTTPSDLAAAIQHACAYPFARPACSYLFKDGGMHPLSPDFHEGRIPVLASGSNASPKRLRAKFDDADDPIPVTKAVLHDFAVVFAGHFTGYGAIPATLAPSPKASTTVWITWLTRPQLAIMHRSEGVIACREVEQRYDYIELGNLDLHPEQSGPVSSAGAYLSRRMMAPEGHPIRFAEVSSRQCQLRALNQRSVLRLAHKLLDPDVSFSMFMSRVLSDPSQRQALFYELSPKTMPRQIG